MLNVFLNQTRLIIVKKNFFLI